MQVQRRSGYVPTPWKNGGGVTYELARHPPTGELFRWRLSIAQVDAGGPFSDFSGYARTLVLLRGGGLRLGFADGRQVHLREPGELVEFDGALPVHCDLLGEACMDLNLMVAQSLPAARGWVETLHAPRVVEPPRRGVLLVLAVHGALRISAAGDLATLSAWDLAVVGAEEGRVGIESTDPQTPPLVFLADLPDN